MNYKIVISFITIILTLVGYVPYIRDIVNKKTKPHAFTWFIFTIAGSIAYGLQVFGGAGVGSWGLLSAVIACFIIFFFSLKIGDKDITYSDFIFLFLSLLSLFLWIVVKQPVWSAILATAVEVLGFAPTVRKTWNKPHSETLWTYEVGFFRHGISILALQKFNILTLLYPIVWTATNLIFSTFLIIRRKRVLNKH